MRLCCVFANSTISLVDFEDAPPHLELSEFRGTIKVVHVLERLSNGYADPVNGIIMYEEVSR